MPTNTLPALPDGATEASEFDDDTRVVFGRRHQAGPISVCASAIQTLTGDICDGPEPGPPSVQLSGADAELTPQQARRLALALLDAAELADQWASAAGTHK